MKILYAISVVLLFVTSLLLKKKNEKIDIITTFFVSLIIFTCYNIVVSFALKIISIEITLMPLSIINYAISAVVAYKIMKSKEIQKYYILKKDIVAVAIITIVGLGVAYINFGFPFDISYVATDAANHYGMATAFYQNGDIILGSHMPGAYINYGIIFKVFFECFGTFDGYKLFIICEIIKLILAGILFYLAIKNIIKNKIGYVNAVIFSLIYMIGYPLNGMLSGFVYLQMAVNIVNVIIIIMMNYKEMDNKTKNSVLFTLLFGLSFSYLILVPPIYACIFLNEFKENRKNKLKFIKNVLILFAITCIVVALYYIIPKVQSSPNYSEPVKKMAVPAAHTAYTFVSYYAMFIYFVPFNIYYIVNRIKKKEFDLLAITLILTVLYIIATLILKELGYVARYYCMKVYFMLWLIVLAVAARGILELLNSNTKKVYKALSVIAIGVYVVGLIYTTAKGPVPIKVFEIQKETIKSIYTIFPLNRGIMKSETFDTIYTHKELKVLKELTQNLEKDAKVVFFEDDLNVQWLNKLTNISTYLTLYDLYEENGIDKYLINTNEKIYVICYKNEFIKHNLGRLVDEMDEKLNVIAKEGKLIIYTNK